MQYKRQQQAQLVNNLTRENPQGINKDVLGTTGLGVMIHESDKIPDVGYQQKQLIDEQT